MGPELKIRMAKKDDKKDAAGIAKIINANARKKPESALKETTEEKEISYLENLKDDEFVLVAYLEDEIAGFQSLVRYEKTPGTEKRGSIGTYVLKEHIRKGIASELLKLTCKIAKEEYGYKTIFAEISKNNEDSIQVHKNLGFKFVEEGGSIAMYKNEKSGIDYILMKLEL